MKTSAFFWVAIASLKILCITPELFAADERPRASAARLAFQRDDSGNLFFNTGVVKGTLTKDGIGEALRTITFIDGNVAVDQNHGLLCPYRFLTPKRRYGFGSWEWPRTGKVLSNGAAQLLWGSAPDRPFAFSTVYHWKSADTLDFTVFFSPQTNLEKFELFLGSYFDKFTIGKAYVKDAHDGMPGLHEAVSNRGEIQLFPSGQEVLPMIKDGRWRFPPYPMNMVIQRPLAGALGMRTQPGSGVSVVFMSPPQDCFAMSMWTKGWSQCAFYLSLFGNNIKRGETVAAHARLCFGKNITETQVLDKYSEYLKEIQNNQDDALLTTDEIDAMQKVFAAPPSEANAVKPPAWFSTEVPKPNADGWIELFDGKRLSGCKPSAADFESRKVDLQNGLLRLDSADCQFNVSCRDVCIRARLKKVSGQNCGMSVRRGKETAYSDYDAWFNGRNVFGLGRAGEKSWKSLTDAHSQKNYNGFFEMELEVRGDTLTLKADGETICTAHDSSLAGGLVGVGTLRGASLFERIEVRPLDK